MFGQGSALGEVTERFPEVKLALASTFETSRIRLMGETPPGL